MKKSLTLKSVTLVITLFAVLFAIPATPKVSYSATTLKSSEPVVTAVRHYQVLNEIIRYRKRG